VARVGPPGLSDTQKREIWRRWKHGQSLSEIARALEKVPGSIHNVVSANGGFVPATRTRPAKALSLGEREEISRGLARDASLRAIAAQLGRAPSTVSREVNPTAAGESTGQRLPTNEPGTTPAAQNVVYCRASRVCVTW